MGSTRNSRLDTPHHSTPPHPPQTRASLPPKPASQKRTRNNNAAPSTAVSPPAAPTPHTPQQPRPRRSWTRRSASWTPEEDAKLIQLVRKETSVPPSITASKTWSRVAAQLTKRTGKQCRERYLNQLKPGIRRDPWSPEEERILHEAHARFGNKWVTIAAQLPGRTDNCVKNHWNSMLRKRQRREAALRAAQDGRNSKVTAVLHIAAEQDHKPDPDHSIFTGCGTPSGASSSNHDVPPSSGIPSPFTASSPITPKRDIKLQISSLVAASSKEVPAWNTPLLTGKMPSRPQSPGHSLLESGQPQMSTFPSGHPSFPAQGQGHTKRLTRSASALIGNPNPAFSCRYNAQDSQRLVLPCSKPIDVNSFRTATDGDAKASDIPVFHRQLRRSARLTSASQDKSRGGSSDWALKSSCGITKPATLKEKRRSQGAGNPLAALAAAASSVPPSPLTPESRFSGTSRSRSASPSPRATPDARRATSGNGVAAVKSGVTATLEGIGITGSSQAEHFQSGGNIAVRRSIGAETIKETKNGQGKKVGRKEQCNDEDKRGTETQSLTS